MEKKILPLLLCLASAASARSNDNVVDQPTGVNDSISLNEVVVTGQGAQIQRRRLSSTFVKVQAKDLSPVTSGRLDVALQDALPTVQFSVTTSQPGATSIIRSRGLSSAFANSTPVIYVDGVRMDNTNTDIYAAASHHGYSAEPYSTSDLPMGQTAATGSIGDIPLDNIDHIEYVPGGAATTLYGSDAANGVIQIFTRKGGDGRFHAFFSTQFGLDEANSQYYYFKRTKDLLNQTGLEQVYRLGFDGGNERFGYSFGASMGQNTGTLIHNGNDSKRYSMRFGSRVKINKILDYDNSFGFLTQDFRRTRNGNQGLYTGLWTTECSAANDLRYTAADGTVKNFNADIDAMDDEEYGIFKTFVSDAERLQYNRTNIKRFQTAHTLTLTPFKGFSVKGIFGLDYRRSTNKEITTNEWLILTQVKPEGTSDAGRVFNTDRDYLGITADINARHSLYLGNWLSNIATVGFQYFNTHDKQTMLNGTNVRDGVKVMSGAGTITGDEYLSYLHSYGRTTSASSTATTSTSACAPTTTVRSATTRAGNGTPRPVCRTSSATRTSWPHCGRAASCRACACGPTRASPATSHRPSHGSAPSTSRLTRASRLPPSANMATPTSDRRRCTPMRADSRPRCSTTSLTSASPITIPARSTPSSAFPHCPPRDSHRPIWPTWARYATMAWNGRSASTPSTHATGR